jgi:hypothetical protein
MAFSNVVEHFSLFFSNVTEASSDFTGDVIEVLELDARANTVSF